MIAKPSFAAPGPSALQAGYFPSSTRGPALLGWLAMIVGALLQCASADVFGDFTYTDEGTTITITDYPETAVGPVLIPDEIVGKPVTSIGFEAFAGCTGITGVTIPSSVTNIADRAFFNCLAMTGVTIPVGVTSIGLSAFSNCRSLLSAVIPDGVTLINSGLFLDCVALTSVSLPNGITSIGSNAFSNCSALTALIIPSTVTAINSNAFVFCSSLTSMVIPEGVTSIGGSCFAECTNLASVSLPNSLTSIGSFAFTKCVNLTSMVIPSGVTALQSSTFESCTLLASVTLPATLKTIGNNVFRVCSALVSIDIPASVTSISNSSSTVDVFGSCSSLMAINVAETNPNYSSADGVLFNKAKTTLITYPRGLAGSIAVPGSYAVPSTVTSIGAGAFRFAKTVASITIPTSVITIGAEAFLGCDALTEIAVAAANGNFSSVDGVLFNKLQTNLIAFPGGLGGEYSIPAGVTSITASAFRFNAGLTGVTFPTGVTSIGSNAFASCPLLASATFNGNAPGTMNTNAFSGAASGFNVFYQTGATGFTNPWFTYTTVELGAITNWLASYGLPAGSDLGSDDNKDGVSLLMAYALDLNPNLNLSNSLPQPVFETNQMRLTFKTGASGVTYRVETCTNFSDWTTNGVTLTTPDPVTKLQTATVLYNGPTRFMRLVVTN